MTTANYSDLFPCGTGGATIAAIHRGLITISGSGTASATATIPAVDVTKSVAYYLGGSSNQGQSDSQGGFARVELTNATTVTMTRQSSAATIGEFSFVVIEFAGGIASVSQYTGTHTANATIAPVDMSKSAIVYQGFTAGFTAVAQISPTYELTSSTDVVMSNFNTNGQYGFAILEFE